MSEPECSGVHRRPDWLRKKRNLSRKVSDTRRGIRTWGLRTVCESACCPNLTECFERGVATIMILGDHCTRNCRFCAVSPGRPEAPDPAEAEAVRAYVESGGISYLVITSVTRDDLADGGASHFVLVVKTLRKALPQLKIELLVPDFEARPDAIDAIADLPVSVIGHNPETVKRLSPAVRPAAVHTRSLVPLQALNARATRGQRIKSGIMVGLGENGHDLARLFADLASRGLDILTIGQYLRPTRSHFPVKRYYRPDEFERLAHLARQAGIGTVVSGAYVRSSYLAERAFFDSLEKNV